MYLEHTVGLSKPGEGRSVGSGHVRLAEHKRVVLFDDLVVMKMTNVR